MKRPLLFDIPLTPRYNMRLTYQMRPPHLVYSLGIVQLDVQILIDALQCSADLHFVLELNCDFVLDERLEETGSVSAN